MFNGHKIKLLLESRKQTRKSLLGFVNITGAALDNIINGVSMPKADNLEKIADFFELPIDYFFDRNIKTSEQTTTVNGNGNKVQNGNGNVMIENQAKEREHLKQLLEEKERTIQILLKKQ